MFLIVVDGILIDYLFHLMSVAFSNDDDVDENEILSSAMANVDDDLLIETRSICVCHCSDSGISSDIFVVSTNLIDDNDDDHDDDHHLVVDCIDRHRCVDVYDYSRCFHSYVFYESHLSQTNVYDLP